MTIAPYGTAASAAARADASFRTLKADLGALQEQLSTGRVASTYAGLGAAARTSLAGRTSLAAVQADAANVADGKLRVGFASSSVTALAKIASGLATSLPPTLNAGPVGQTSATISAEDGLKQAIELLNTEVGGRYLFSGRTPDVEPVSSYATMLDGEPGRAGLRQLVSERKEADLGQDGLGRLVLGGSGTGATLTEEAASLPFGLKLDAASATGGGITAARAAGPPGSVGFDVAAQPSDGDTVTLTFGLPDGTTQTVTLTARANAATGATTGSFAIGATASDTAANLRAALQSAVGSTAATALAAASTRKAAADFFAGSTSSPPERVAGPPFATATATVAGTAADTVIWYPGDDGSGSARATSSVRTGDGTSVAVGARANEGGIRDVLAALGALAADSFPASDATSAARYTALASRVSAAAGTSPVQDIASDLAVANGELGAAATRLTAAKAHLEDVVADAENADPNEVATQLLAVQTRLQAAYQATSAISKLSLVDFM